ncbi:Uma2 family endonuclease [Sinosporangium siamense]|uniref:Uma2 family endonuclease n=1 Tax=Sinosporangium siamense TaxID=1367973 RepID=UPI0035EC373F
MTSISGPIMLPGRPSFTVADLFRFPDDGCRYELFDGSLFISPAPSSNHQITLASLMREVSDALTSGYEVLPPVNIMAGGTDFFVPDLAVVRSAVAETVELMYEPADILLAVEVVSPHTRMRDRVLKPAAYAAAGIPSYWRIEPGPAPVIHTHDHPGENGYQVVAQHAAGKVAKLETPFSIAFDPAVLATVGD